jgi:hypothetical protein
MINFDFILTAINILALLFFAGLCNGRMDYIKIPGKGTDRWKNKWELDENGNTKPAKYYWYYFGLFTPEHEEKFIYSSTMLVFITDEWHWKKWLCFACIEMAISYLFIKAFDLPWWLVPLLVLLSKGIRGLGFNLIYEKK